MPQEYKLLSAGSSGVLSEIVQRHLDDGWELYAQPQTAKRDVRGFFFKTGDYVIYLQAVVRQKDGE